MGKVDAIFVKSKSNEKRVNSSDIMRSLHQSERSNSAQRHVASAFHPSLATGVAAI
jgi:hypothetical protein